MSHFRPPPLMHHIDAFAIDFTRISSIRLRPHSRRLRCWLWYSIIFHFAISFPHYFFDASLSFAYFRCRPPHAMPLISFAAIRCRFVLPPFSLRLPRYFRHSLTLLITPLISRHALFTRCFSFWSFRLSLRHSFRFFFDADISPLIDISPLPFFDDGAHFRHATASLITPFSPCSYWYFTPFRHTRSPLSPMLPCHYYSFDVFIIEASAAAWRFPFMIFAPLFAPFHCHRPPDYFRFITLAIIAFEISFSFIPAISLLPDILPLLFSLIFHCYCHAITHRHMISMSFSFSW